MSFVKSIDKLNLKINICHVLFTHVYYLVVLMAQKLFDSPQMRQTIRRLIRARMAFKGFEYKDLARGLDALGVVQSESNLRSKVNNGSLGAQGFVYILLALDMRQLDLVQVEEILAELNAQSPGDAAGAAPAG